MESRMDFAVAKNCDGCVCDFVLSLKIQQSVEPDNVDGYTQDTGFDISYDDQIYFNTYLLFLYWISMR